jgi:hypothetical protein
METRKKRATELIEKCDMKVLSSTERTQVVQIYDRRVKIGLGESVLDNMSLYSAVRSWVQDDPDKLQQDNIRVGKVRHPAPFVAEDISVSVKRRDDDLDDNILSADSKVTDNFVVSIDRVIYGSSEESESPSDGQPSVI